MFNNRKKFIAVAAFILTITTFSIAYAAHTTINTNDGSVDPNWSNVSVLSNDGDDIANNNYDIDQAWIANAADNSGVYFRVSLIDSGQLPTNYSSFEARLDCNQNGNYFDNVDVIVYYAINGTTEELVECQGNEYPDCDYNPEPNHSDTNAASFGEAMSGARYNYEWQADPINGTTDWSQCFGSINVQFTSLDNILNVQDSTVARAYNIPTAIHFVHSTASPGDRYLSVLGGIGILFLTIATLWIVRLSKRRND